jgi:hypothetical protein
MTLTRLNLISSLIALAGALNMLFVSSFAALVWGIFSLIWLASAITGRQNQAAIACPARIVTRRFSRLLLFS